MSDNNLSEQQQQINSLLQQCQQLAVPPVSKVAVVSSDTEEHTLTSALESLYNALLALRNPTASNDGSFGNFRQSVAEHLIFSMNRTIKSLEEEIEGPFKDGDYSYDWNDFASQPKGGCSDSPTRKHPEKLIDQCLDLCGYGVSLEVAIDCLRQVVRACNKRSADTNDLDTKPNLAAVVSSLRTIRRRFLVTCSNCSKKHLEGVMSVSQLDKKQYQQVQEFLGLDNHYSQYVEHILLPLEYYNSNRTTSLDDDLLLSDSLVLLATTVIPGLVSSACHVMQIPLPIWASREAHSHLLGSAFRMVLAESILGQCQPTIQSKDTSLICAATSAYFQGLMNHIIRNRDATVAIRLVYQVWNSVESNDDENKVVIANTANPEPRSILRSHLESVLISISSKRDAASFIRSMVRFLVSKRKSQLTKPNPTNQPEFDAVCKKEVIPSLAYFLIPLLSRDAELREAVVDFVIMSPPSSFKITGTDQQSLHIFDKLIPRCICTLLCSACSSSTTAYLEHLSTAAAVWREDIFVDKTPPLQQQYVTEFLLAAIEVLSPDSIQVGVDETDASLASMFIQGVSLRLEVSRPESVRRDGMRIAEAMACIFGQSLSFDELHPPQQSGERINAKSEPKPNSASDSDSDSESSSDASSWGEDSLEPYRMDDDEEDLRRVSRPRSLRDCVAYLLTNHEDREAYDKHEAALQELPALVLSRPLDFIDVAPTLVRVLLHMEDKFNMDGFSENRWDSLMACAIQAPVETSFKLVEEMKGHVSLGTRIEALSVISCTAEELSGFTSSKEQKRVIEDKNGELTDMSTRLRNSLALEHDHSAIQHKTRRWRQKRTANLSIPNRFNAISAQMILPLFAFLAQTKSDEAIWGGSLGERLLSEYLRTLTVMVDCARTCPSTRVLASDLFELAWSFHNAKNAEVRRAVLIAISTSISVDPVGQINNINSGLFAFLADVSTHDSDAGCREIATSIAGTFTNAYPLITS